MYTAKESEIKEPISFTGNTWVPVPYRITGKKTESKHLLTLTMEPAGEESIAPIAAGQFNMLYVFGVGEIPISVSSLDTPHPTLIHTIQQVGPASKAINSLDVGDTIGIRGPFGTVWPVGAADSKDVIIMAGGVGLCPLRPLIENVLSERDRFGEVNILYGSREPDRIIFHQDIIAWQSDPSINFHITVDHAFSHWRGNVGVVTQLIDKASFAPDNTVAFICGPEVMMRYGAYACMDSHVDERNIYLSMERNMKCAIGFCGHCQFGPHFVCKEGAVFPYSVVRSHLNIAEL